MNDLLRTLLPSDIVPVKQVDQSHCTKQQCSAKETKKTVWVRPQLPLTVVQPKKQKTSHDAEILNSITHDFPSVADVSLADVDHHVCSAPTNCSVEHSNLADVASRDAEALHEHPTQYGTPVATLDLTQDAHCMDESRYRNSLLQNALRYASQSTALQTLDDCCLSVVQMATAHYASLKESHLQISQPQPLSGHLTLSQQAPRQHTQPCRDQTADISPPKNAHLPTHTSHASHGDFITRYFQTSEHASVEKPTSDDSAQRHPTPPVFTPHDPAGDQPPESAEPTSGSLILPLLQTELLNRNRRPAAKQQLPSSLPAPTMHAHPNPPDTRAHQHSATSSVAGPTSTITRPDSVPAATNTHRTASTRPLPSKGGVTLQEAGSASTRPMPPSICVMPHEAGAETCAVQLVPNAPVASHAIDQPSKQQAIQCSQVGTQMCHQSTSLSYQPHHQPHPEMYSTTAADAVSADSGIAAAGTSARSTSLPLGACPGDNLLPARMPACSRTHAGTAAAPAANALHHGQDYAAGSARCSTTGVGSGAAAPGGTHMQAVPPPPSTNRCATSALHPHGQGSGLAVPDSGDGNGRTGAGDRQVHALGSVDDVGRQAAIPHTADHNSASVKLPHHQEEGAAECIQQGEGRLVGGQPMGGWGAVHHAACEQHPPQAVGLQPEGAGGAAHVSDVAGLAVQPGASCGGAHVPAASCCTAHETDLSFWDFGVVVYETFPWQNEAFEYADWCNLHGPAAVKMLQASARQVNFTNFSARWQHLQQQMRRIAKEVGTTEQQREITDCHHTAPCAAPAPADAQEGQQGGGQARDTHSHPGGQQGAHPQAEGERDGRDGRASSSGSHNAPATSMHVATAPAKVEKVRVFCQEYLGRHGSHSRHFVAASYQALWRRYCNTPAERRHFYEVIRGGQPCHLYFDLEFMRVTNAETDGEALVDVLVELLGELMEQQWGLQMCPDWILELDSSTAEKFSRHIVLRVPGCAFPNNLVVGQVVSQLRAHSKAMQLLVNRENGDGKVSMIDSAVYTKNRHFRMFMSCKGGKAQHLKETERFMASAQPTPLRVQLFLKSLICNTPPLARLLLPSWCTTPRPLQPLLPSAVEMSDIVEGVVDIPHPAQTAGEYGGARPIKMSWIYLKGPKEDRSRLQRLQQVAVAAVLFVEDVGTERAGGLPAQVRSMAYCGEGGTVAYGLIGPGSHYCSNVERCHRSNHAFLVLDFFTGQYCQKCYDPDCSGYRSPWIPLPTVVWRKDDLHVALLKAQVGGLEGVVVDPTMRPSVSEGGMFGNELL